MKEINTEVLIIGSGLVGLVAAHAFSVLNYDVTVVEKKNFLNLEKPLKDTRTVAVSEGSKQFLDNLNLWRLLDPYTESIKKINVYGRYANNKIVFENNRQQEKLGYVIENNKFSKVLFNNLKKFKNIKFLFDQNITKINTKENYSITHLVNCTIKSKLIIAADGKNSTVRKILGTNFFNKKYNEKALVINFFHERPHNNIAYEIFLKTGPLAILPMQKERNRNQSALIWSNKPEIVDKIASSDLHNKYVEEILNEKIYQQVGNITKINSLQSFPLSAHINEKFYDNKTVYVGDAAHSIHPIAGQGWNLGLRDVSSITKLLRKTKEEKAEIGTKIFCKMYNDSCYYDAYRLFEITDKLDWIFKKDQFYFKFLKKVGFNILNKNTIFKEEIVKFAMGV